MRLFLVNNDKWDSLRLWLLEKPVGQNFIQNKRKQFVSLLKTPLLKVVYSDEENRAKIKCLGRIYVFHVSTCVPWDYHHYQNIVKNWHNVCKIDEKRNEAECSPILN